MVNIIWRVSLLLLIRYHNSWKCRLRHLPIFLSFQLTSFIHIRAVNILVISDTFSIFYSIRNEWRALKLTVYLCLQIIVKNRFVNIWFISIDSLRINLRNISWCWLDVIIWWSWWINLFCQWIVLDRLII